ncbi:hypothetical protein BFL35_07740 [Clavibacter michiganensis]|nr:hypothetical protein BFL35_07740 [Clavibacter michiganensis]
MPRGRGVPGAGHDRDRGRRAPRRGDPPRRRARSGARGGARRDPRGHERRCRSGAPGGADGGSLPRGRRRQRGGRGGADRRGGGRAPHVPARPSGRGQDHARPATPRAPARPRRGGSAGGRVHPIALRGAAGTRAPRPAAPGGPAPHGERRGDRRGRQRADPPRRRGACQRGSALPRRGTRVRGGGARLPAAAARVGRRQHPPGERGRALPGAVPAGHGRQPVPVRSVRRGRCRLLLPAPGPPALPRPSLRPAHGSDGHPAGRPTRDQCGAPRRRGCSAGHDRISPSPCRRRSCGRRRAVGADALAHQRPGCGHVAPTRGARRPRRDGGPRSGPRPRPPHHAGLRPRPPDRLHAIETYSSS